MNAPHVPSITNRMTMTAISRLRIFATLLLWCVLPAVARRKFTVG